jgi:predicted DNA-binding protein|tara:strand:- start:493 stop:681 length:189 start_codon:yes stop_codon:yes gene_type:complete
MGGIHPSLKKLYKMNNYDTLASTRITKKTNNSLLLVCQKFDRPKAYCIRIAIEEFIKKNQGE